MEHCQRSGCSGAIIDGACDECGRPPLGKSLLQPSAAAATVTTGVTVSSLAAAARAASASGLTLGSASRGSQAGTASNSYGATGSGTAGSGRRGSRGSSSRRNKLGGGLISLPPLPSTDPEQLVLADAKVPEDRRFCPSCNGKVGRGDGAKPGREKGFCKNCGAEYNFTPSLAAGDRIGDLEIKGPIAHGGLGWIYLAYDTQLMRYVVLKGLLNTNDPTAAAAAVAERQFLAAIKHTKIVGVYTFLTRGTEGFIVMEYVGGTTLRQIRRERGPLPVDEAIAYILGVLPSFGYLHERGMVYCDFKPDNVMREGDDVKLIDLGAVRRIDDTDGSIFGTKGYYAPEVDLDRPPAEISNPTPCSDLYTIGRSLAVLILDTKDRFRYNSKDQQFTLPTPAQEPLFAKYDSLYRFLLRATHADPDARFQSADEMQEQLQGVFREIISVDGGSPKGFSSENFMGDALVDADLDVGVTPGYHLLPPVIPDDGDEGTSWVLSGAALRDPNRRLNHLEAGRQRFPGSLELLYRMVEILTDIGRFAEIDALIETARKVAPFDWRTPWFQGRAQMAQGRHEVAIDSFDAVYSELPGELAPKLAIGLAYELQGNSAEAERRYAVVVATEPNHVSAAFGLARCRARTRDRNGAADALRLVPASSSVYTVAQLSLARTLLDPDIGSTQTPDEILLAADVVKAITAEGVAINRLIAQTFLAALGQIETGGLKPDAKRTVLDRPLVPRELRIGAEIAYRACARHAATREAKFAYVDQANRVRPRTFV